MSGDSSFSRPERSSARTSEGANGGGGGMTGAVTNAANQIYQNAPDLGVGAAISSYMNQGQQSEGPIASKGSKPADDFDEHEDDRVLPSRGNKKEASEETKDNRKSQETPRELSERTGPSNEARVGKSQFEVGTETGIPTNAGEGTTASPDQTNRKAVEKANSQGKTNKAKIPHDFEPLATANSGDRSVGAGSESYSPRRSSANHGGSNKTDTTKSPTSPTVGSSPGGSRKTSGQYAPPITSDGSPLEMEKRRSIGEKIKDQIKGEMKILAGTVSGKDDKIIEGLAIKHGDHHADQ